MRATDAIISGTSLFTWQGDDAFPQVSVLRCLWHLSSCPVDKRATMEQERSRMNKQWCVVWLGERDDFFGNLSGRTNTAKIF